MLHTVQIDNLTLLCLPVFQPDIAAAREPFDLRPLALFRSHRVEIDALLHNDIHLRRADGLCCISVDTLTYHVSVELHCATVEQHAALPVDCGCAAAR